MDKVKDTLIELFIGIGIYFVIAEIVGLVFVENKLTYTAGLVLGTIGAMLLSIHMYYTLNKGLDMDKDAATKYIKNNSFIRLGIMLLILLVGRVITYISFLAVFIGLLGLKIGAFMQPLVNKFRSTKINKEGR